MSRHWHPHPHGGAFSQEFMVQQETPNTLGDKTGFRLAHPNSNTQIMTNHERQ